MLPNGTESASPMKYFPDPTADGLFKGIRYNFWHKCVSDRRFKTMLAKYW